MLRNYEVDRIWFASTKSVNYKLISAKWDIALYNTAIIGD